MIMTDCCGGEGNLQGAGSVARDQQQIKNFRRLAHSKGDNALHAVMLECKLAQGKKNTFVRDVKAAPEPMAVCFTDWQLQDLQRFYTNPAKFTYKSLCVNDFWKGVKTGFPNLAANAMQENWMLVASVE